MSMKMILRLSATLITGKHLCDEQFQKRDLQKAVIKDHAL